MILTKSWDGVFLLLSMLWWWLLKLTQQQQWRSLLLCCIMYLYAILLFVNSLPYTVPYCRLVHFCTFLYYASYSLLHIFYFILPSYFLVSCFILSNASLQRFLITTSLSNYTLFTLLFHLFVLFSFSTASPSLLSIQPAACNARKTSIRMECKKITKVDIKHTYN